MSKILINNGDSDVVMPDVGVTISAHTQYTIPPQDYSAFAASSDVIVALADNLLILNNGSFDITVLSDAVDIIKGWFPAAAAAATGPFFFDFSDVISGDAPTTVIFQSVPIDQTFSLINLDISCRIESFTQVYLNGVSIGDLRTGATEPNASFHWFPNRDCAPGDTIEVVITKRAGTADITVGAHLSGVTTLV